MMSKLTEVYKDVPLSTPLLLEMHEILAENTMPKDEICRLRTNADDITVGNLTETVYVTPDDSFMRLELQRLIDYANDTDSQHFVHPIVKAIILHFWIGYLHPFTNGNGRVARALFYWYLLRKNYWLAMYIPISTVIKKAPTQYGDAYIYTEQDNDDFTYFYDYHMRKIRQALEEFIAYVKRQQNENKQIDRLLDVHGRLNERQKQVTYYLLANSHYRVSMTSHSALNNISLGTALSDLQQLQKLQLIFAVRSGKYVYYYAKPLR
jgi:Fic family protein